LVADDAETADRRDGRKQEHKYWLRHNTVSSIVISAKTKMMMKKRQGSATSHDQHYTCSTPLLLMVMVRFVPFVSVATAFQGAAVVRSSNTVTPTRRHNSGRGVNTMLLPTAATMKPLMMVGSTTTSTTAAAEQQERPAKAVATVAAATTTTTAMTTKIIDGPVILFDGVCNFCNAWVDILLRIDIQRQFKFAPLQSTIGRELLVSIGRRPDDITSVILIDPRGQQQNNDGAAPVYYDKSDCVLQVVKTLGWPAMVAANAATALVPIESRNGLYDLVAENRYNFLGKRDECRCGDPQYSDRFLS
jgi:predicted DCC family thiol-disulfide oxidoreductase YuxK